jgi:hypothetical protein
VYCNLVGSWRQCRSRKCGLIYVRSFLEHGVCVFFDDSFLLGSGVLSSWLCVCLVQIGGFGFFEERGIWCIG